MKNLSLILDERKKWPQINRLFGLESLRKMYRKQKAIWEADVARDRGGVGTRPGSRTPRLPLGALLGGICQLTGSEIWFVAGAGPAGLALRLCTWVPWAQFPTPALSTELWVAARLRRAVTHSNEI